MADTVYGNITYHFIKHQFQCFYILLPPFYKGGNRLRKIEICPIHLAKKWKRQHSNPDLLNSQYGVWSTIRTLLPIEEGRESAESWVVVSYTLCSQTH